MELTTLKVNDVETHINKLIVCLRCTKTKKDRMFVVQGDLLKIIQKYQNLRPDGIQSDRFFLNYKNGKCTKQVVGRHKIAAVPKRIAAYLDLPDAKSYTGHCLRRSSATILADTGANLTTLKRHGGWTSDKVAEGYIEESVENKAKITDQINEAILKTSPFEPRPSTSTSPDDTSTNASTASTLNASQSIQQVNLPGKSVQLTLTNCTNCSIVFNMN